MDFSIQASDIFVEVSVCVSCDRVLSSEKYFFKRNNKNIRKNKL